MLVLPGTFWNVLYFYRKSHRLQKLHSSWFIYPIDKTWEFKMFIDLRYNMALCIAGGWQFTILC